MRAATAEAVRSRSHGSAMGEQHPGVDDRGLAEALEVVAEGARPITVEQLAQHRGGGTLASASRPEAAFLDECPSPRRGVGFQPGEVGRGHPAADDELRCRIRDHGPDRVDDRADPRAVG
jgi:hypothetical protein